LTKYVNKHGATKGKNEAFSFFIFYFQVPQLLSTYYCGSRWDE